MHPKKQKKRDFLFFKNLLRKCYASMHPDDFYSHASMHPDDFYCHASMHPKKFKKKNWDAWMHKKGTKKMPVYHTLK